MDKRTLVEVTVVATTAIYAATAATMASCALKDTPRARIVITMRPLGAMAAGWLSHLSGLFYSRCAAIIGSTSPMPVVYRCRRTRRARDYISCSPTYPSATLPDRPPPPTDRRPPSALPSRLCFSLLASRVPSENDRRQLLGRDLLPIGTISRFFSRP